MQPGDHSHAFDVFVSATLRDALPFGSGMRPEDLVAHLREAGLSVFFYEDDIELAASIPDSVVGALARSRILLAWWSPAYPSSRACREELTLALLAEGGLLSEDRSSRRVFAVVDRVDPLELPDRLRELRLPILNEKNDIAAITGAVAKAVGGLTDTFGASSPPERPQLIAGSNQSSAWREGSSNFVGRLRELWAVRDQLSQAWNQTGSGRAGRGLVTVVGCGGSGKSLLAIEYAHLFSTAYPGGVVWMSALGNESARERTPDERNAVRRSEWFALADKLGLGLQPGADESTARRRVSEAVGTLDAILWVIDDLPSGVTRSELDLWMPESDLTNTWVLVTCRSPIDDVTTVRLEGLDSRAALDLLSGEMPPTTDPEREAATQICERLGRHALAVAVAGRVRKRSLRGFVELLALLDEPVPKLDELIERVHGVGALPGDHVAEIVATLRTSILRMPAAGNDLALLAARLPEDILTRAFLEEVAKLAAERRIFPPETRPDAWADEAISAVGEDCCARRSVDFTSNVEGILVHPLVAGTALALVDMEREHSGLSPEDIRAQLDFIIAGALQRRLNSAKGNPAKQRALIPEGRLGLAALETNPRWRNEDERQWDEQIDASLALAGLVAQHLSQLGDAKSAIGLLRESAATLDRVLGPEDRHTLDGYIRLAIALWQDWQTDEALEIETRVLRERKRLLGAKHRDTLQARINLAASLRQAGRTTEAISLVESTIDDFVNVVGENSFEAVQARNNLASYYRELGRFPEAIELFRRAVEQHQLLQPPQPLHELTTLMNLAGVLQDIGELSEAIDIFEEVVRGREDALGLLHPDTLTAKTPAAGGTHCTGRAGLRLDGRRFHIRHCVLHSIS